MKGIRLILLVILLLILITQSFSKAESSNNIQFSAESNVIFFFDKDTGKLYKYNNSGRLTQTYTLKELGKDLELR